MGSLVLPDRGNVYLDANCFIYSIEGVEPYYTILKLLWRAAGDNQVRIITSEMTLLEVLVKPLKNGDADVVNDYRIILHQTPEVQMVPITQDILEEAAKLRATVGIKTPDAIHLATARIYSCALFLTNDMGFRQITEPTITILDDVDFQDSPTNPSNHTS